MTTIEFCFPTTVLTVSGSLGLSQPGLSGYPRKNILKKRQGRKPVSVFKSTIYLRNLPPDIGRAVLICQYIWSCKSQCRSRMPSLTHVVSSYLAFSPLPPREAVIFCYGWREVTSTCDFRSASPCLVRTFLSLSTATDRPTCLAWQK